MYLLYSVLIVMLVTSLGLFAMPFVTTRSISLRYFWGFGLFVMVCSLSIYQISSRPELVKQWLTQGQQHYELQQQVSQLGGVSAIIERIKKKLVENPNDAQGWFILGKLYLAHQNYSEAREALRKAVILRPEDKTIKRFYEIATKKSN